MLSGVEVQVYGKAFFNGFLRTPEHARARSIKHHF